MAQLVRMNTITNDQNINPVKLRNRKEKSFLKAKRQENRNKRSYRYEKCCDILQLFFLLAGRDLN